MLDPVDWSLIGAAGMFGVKGKWGDGTHGILISQRAFYARTHSKERLELRYDIML